MSVFMPHRYVESIEVVDLDDLWRCGIRGLLLDRDNTVVPRNTGKAPESVLAWISRAKEIGFKIWFVSNNHFENVVDDAKDFGFGLVAEAHKPRTSGIKKAMAQMGLSHEEVALIGDQLYTDGFGGLASGVFTVLVVPQCSTDLWYSGPLRLFERIMLCGKKPSKAWDPVCGRGL